MKKWYYFKECFNVEQTKKTYKNLVFKHHPDKGGDLETMKLVNIEYGAKLKDLNGSFTQSETGKNYEYVYNEEIEKAIINKINDLLALKMINVDIYLIGTWLWIVGETKQYKEELKKLSCRWHRKKSCWYFASESKKRYYGGETNFNEIVRKYGAEKIHSKIKELKND